MTLREGSTLTLRSYNQDSMSLVSPTATRATPYKNFNIKFKEKNMNLPQPTSTKDSRPACTMKSMSSREPYKRQGQALKFNLKLEN